MNLISCFRLCLVVNVVLCSFIPHTLATTTHIQEHDSVEPVEVNADVSTNTSTMFKALLSSRRAMRNIEKTCEVPEWKKIADDIDGESSNDNSGRSVSVSEDGRIVAVGSKYNYGRGHTRVYKLNDSDDAWIKVGNDMDGESSGDKSGSSVSLSADGRSVAIGAPYNNGKGMWSGHVRVYKFNDSDDAWIMIGNDIDGEFYGDLSGASVSLSADGRSVAIGAPHNNGNGRWSGHVRVYKFNNSDDAWIMIGYDIDGEFSEERSGVSVSLSADGRSVAVGAPGNDDNENNSGHARVYKLNDSDDVWIKVGNVMSGESYSNGFGSSVSLSANGRSVAIGAPRNTDNGYNSGHVRVFKLNFSDDAWIKVGNDMDGESSCDDSGVSVSLSADGRSVAVGAPGNDDNGGNSGQVLVYKLNDSDDAWIMIGNDMVGESGDKFGISVSLSGDGRSVVVGAPFNSGYGYGSDHTRVYKICTATSALSYMQSGSPSALPSNQYLQPTPSSGGVTKPRCNFFWILNWNVRAIMHYFDNTNDQGWDYYTVNTHILESMAFIILQLQIYKFE